jgi:hypothetical protein
LKEVKKAMAELARTEGRTLAFVHKIIGDDVETIASRDWYAKARWKPMKTKEYCDVLNIMFEYPAYKLNLEEQLKAA